MLCFEQGCWVLTQRMPCFGGSCGVCQNKSAIRLFCYTDILFADITSCMQYMSRVDEIIYRASSTALPGEDCRGLFAVVPQNIYKL